MNAIKNTLQWVDDECYEGDVKTGSSNKIATYNAEEKSLILHEVPHVYHDCLSLDVAKVAMNDLYKGTTIWRRLKELLLKIIELEKTLVVKYKDYPSSYAKMSLVLEEYERYVNGLIGKFVTYLESAEVPGSIKVIPRFESRLTDEEVKMLNKINRCVEGNKNR